MLTQKRLARRSEGGFTLIELLIVIVILGILVAIVLFAVGSFTGTSAQAACKTDMKQLATASSAYYSQNGKWPLANGDLSPTYIQTMPPTSISSSSHYAVTIAYGAASTTPPTISGTYDDGSVAGATCQASITP